GLRAASTAAERHADVFRSVPHRGMSVGIERLPDQLLEECHRVYAAAPRRPDEKLLQVRVKRERPLLAPESRLGHNATYIIRTPWPEQRTVPAGAPARLPVLCTQFNTRNQAWVSNNQSFAPGIRVAGASTCVRSERWTPTAGRCYAGRLRSASRDHAR